MAYTPEDPEPPSWKRDFPIRQEEASHITRREFAKFLCLVSGGMMVGNGYVVLKAYAFPEEAIEGEHFICNTSEVPVGGMKQFIIQGNQDIPYILIRLKEGTWRAYEQKCTHLSCAVLYQEDINKIVCPCHEGYFDPDTGAVLQGPPPRDLPQLKVTIREEKVFVSQETENLT